MIEATTVIIAIGTDSAKSIEGEDKFLGRGVSYCATCDAPLYNGKEVCVLGYNKESIHEANFLNEIAAKKYAFGSIEWSFGHLYDWTWL